MPADECREYLLYRKESNAINMAVVFAGKNIYKNNKRKGPKSISYPMPCKHIITKIWTNKNIFTNKRFFMFRVHIYWTLHIVHWIQKMYSFHHILWMFIFCRFKYEHTVCCRFDKIYFGTSSYKMSALCFVVEEYHIVLIFHRMLDSSTLYQSYL